MLAFVAVAAVAFLAGHGNFAPTAEAQAGKLTALDYQEITPTADGAKGRVYLVQLGMNGPGTIERHGGYEDIYVRTPEGWRIKQRMHVRNKAWHAEALRTPDLN